MMDLNNAVDKEKIKEKQSVGNTMTGLEGQDGLWADWNKQHR